MALTLEMLEEKYPQADWTHIYTDGSAEVCCQKWRVWRVCHDPNWTNSQLLKCY